MESATLSEANLSFTLNGDDEIDVQTLIGIMDSLSSLIKETALSCCPDARCQVKVAAHRSGSFEVVIKALAFASQSFLNS